MRCVTPMFRLFKEYTPEEERYIEQFELKKWAKIISRQEAWRMLLENPYKLRQMEDLNETWKKQGSTTRIQQIPCGHCWACMLNKAADWATRCMYEAKGNEHNYWVTLTYDDEHLPLAEKIKYKKWEGKEWYYDTFENPLDDERWLDGTLVEEDVQKFLNTMRKSFERRGHTGIRYFYAAEYGSGELNGNHRPHYHIILFNCPLSIDCFYDCHMEDYLLRWKSAEIDQWWKKGIAEVTEVEWANAAYTARYNMKSLIDGSKTEEQYAAQGKVKEFIRMSRHPGIGMEYYYKNKDDIYKNDEIITRTFRGTCVVKPPKAWDRKFKETNPEAYELLKISRIQAMERAEKLKRELTNYTDLERLKIDQENILTKANMLKREL